MDNKRWDRLMQINRKACEAINSLKTSASNEAQILLTKEELYEITSLSGDTATILKRL